MTDQTGLVTALKRMLRIRRFEEAVIELNLAGAYAGHAHVSIGQEATCAAIAAALKPGDLVADHHRNHGHYVARDHAPMPALAEILGRADGTNRGRGGSAHLCDPKNGLVWSTAIVGGSIGLALGLGFAIRQLGRTGAIAVAFFGDGALEEGIAFESFNMAAIFGLPVLFVCENNSGGAIGHAAFEWPSSTLRVRRLTDMPGALGIPCAVVDGARFEETFEAVSALVEPLRRGQGPAFLEARTERWPGSKYARTQLATGITDVSHGWRTEAITGEHAAWVRDHDPVIAFVRDLFERRVLSRDELVAIDAEARREIDAARQAALASPPPATSDVHGQVFA